MRKFYLINLKEILTTRNWIRAHNVRVHTYTTKLVALTLYARSMKQITDGKIIRGTEMLPNVVNDSKITKTKR